MHDGLCTWRIKKSPYYDHKKDKRSEHAPVVHRGPWGTAREVPPIARVNGVEDDTYLFERWSLYNAAGTKVPVMFFITEAEAIHFCMTGWLP